MGAFSADFVEVLALNTVLVSASDTLLVLEESAWVAGKTGTSYIVVASLTTSRTLSTLL